MMITDRIRIAFPPAQQQLAEKLRKALAGYRIPRSVKRGNGIRSLDDVREDWLIVVCTPETPDDPEVLSAINEFLREGKRDRILTLLAAGTPETGFPEALLREEKPDGTVVLHEPLAANITAGDGGGSLKKLRIEKLRILAPMLHSSFDGLMDRGRRKRNRILLAAGAAAVTASVVFLGLAFSRLRTTAVQEAELRLQYERTEEARAETEAQAHEARLRLADSIAIQAEGVLEKHNTELALLLCLEFEKEIPESEALKGTLESALRKLCAAGYVPVTNEKGYKRTRGMEKVLVDGSYNNQIKPGTETGAGLERECRIPVPESRQGDPVWLNDDGIALMGRRCYSTAYDSAVYTGTLKYDEPNERLRAVWIRSVSDPKSAYWLRKPDGTLFTVGSVSGTEILDGGILLLFGDSRPLRYDLLNRQWIPTPDGGEGEAAELPFPVSRIMADTAVRDRVFVFGEKSVAAYEKDSFRLLYMIDDEVTENAVTSDNSGNLWVGATAGVLPDGEGRLLVSDGHVYDTKDGTYLFQLEKKGPRFAGTSEYGTHEFTAEGWLPVCYGSTLCVYDMKDGSMVAEVSGTGGNRYGLYGPADEKTGQRSASLILTYISQSEATETYPRIFWEYHETAATVPDTLEEQIILAKKLLNGRELVPSERNRYHLD